jgi:hypothetical protein
MSGSVHQRRFCCFLDMFGALLTRIRSRPRSPKCQFQTSKRNTHDANSSSRALASFRSSVSRCQTSLLCFLSCQTELAIGG